jgi:hypothetical protein
MPPIPNPDYYAIVVGIDHYDKDLKKLNGARNDAQFFCDWLKSPTGGGLDENHIKLILSEHKNGQRTPNRDEVEDAMREHINHYRDTDERRQRLYLFVSGHGVSPADGGDECLFLMANAARDALGRNIPVQTSANIFWKGAVFREVVLFADCCRSVAYSKARIPLSFAETAEELILAGQGVKTSMICGLATKWSHQAREQELPHPDNRDKTVTRGRFTYALLDGLKRAADEEGNVTASSLGDYVTTMVQRLGGAQDGQTPQIRFEGDLVLLSGVTGKTKVLVSLRNPVDRIEILDGMNITKKIQAEQKVVEPGLLEVSLTPGLYFMGVPRGDGSYNSSCNVTVADEVIHVEL